ncbi:MAG: response regulator [Nitrospirae bacterium]|nr:response regulator [Nitrospirota bacterium]MBI3351962.1 response regulator [Nitrospirota bacterium]
MAQKVLLIDDSDFVRTMFLTVLMTGGFQVSAAKDGNEGIAAITKEKPDLILLDLMMPVMDGFKVLSFLRGDPKTADIPVIVLSAKGNPEEIQKAMSLGAKDFLIKSTTPPKKVLEKVKFHLSSPK